MTDRERVIEGLEYLITAYAFHGDDVQCLGDAVELLKEQEPVKPVKEQIFSFIFGWNCGACSFPLLSDCYMYCPKCGRKVKWE